MNESPSALLMGYGFDRQDFHTPENSAKLVCHFAVQKLLSGDFKRLVLVAGDINPKHHPVIADAMTKYIRQISPEDLGERLVCDPLKGRSNTLGELARFRDLARKGKWQDLAVVCAEQHARRVRRHVPRLLNDGNPPRNKVQIYAAEAELVLDPGYAEFITAFRQSEEYHEFKMHEVYVNCIDWWPGGHYVMDWWARQKDSGQRVTDVIRFRRKLIDLFVKKLGTKKASEPKTNMSLYRLPQISPVQKSSGILV